MTRWQNPSWNSSFTTYFIIAGWIGCLCKCKLLILIWICDLRLDRIGCGKLGCFVAAIEKSTARLKPSPFKAKTFSKQGPG